MDLAITSYTHKKQNIGLKGKEIAELLGYTNTEQAIRHNIDSEDSKT